MLQYDEIKDIITNKLGLKTLTDYQKYIAEFHTEENPRKAMLEELELLSPERINNGDFWKVVEELFGIDCVANTMFKTISKDEGNFNNLRLARLAGTLNVIDVWRHAPIQILEIGAGYGNFKQYVLNTTNFGYTGVDVYPKVEGIIPTLPNGLLPDEIKAKTFPLIYSSNVFQHLSTFQRSAYLKDIAEMLPFSGAFTFNLILRFEKNGEGKNEAVDGKHYMKHYGQFTEIPNYSTFMQELADLFWIENETRTMNQSLFSFLCRSKKTPPPTPPVLKVEEKTITTL